MLGVSIALIFLLFPITINTSKIRFFLSERGPFFIPTLLPFV